MTNNYVYISVGSWKTWEWLGNKEFSSNSGSPTSGQNILSTFLRETHAKILQSGFFRNETKRICHDDWELGFRINPDSNKIDFSTIEKDVIIYHGDKDKLIPTKSSQYLVTHWNPDYKAELHIKKGKDHSNIKGSCLHDIFRSIVEHSQYDTFLQDTSSSIIANTD